MAWGSYHSLASSNILSSDNYTCVFVLLHKPSQNTANTVSTQQGGVKAKREIKHLIAGRLHMLYLLLFQHWHSLTSWAGLPLYDVCTATWRPNRAKVAVKLIIHNIHDRGVHCYLCFSTSINSPNDSANKRNGKTISAGKPVLHPPHRCWKEDKESVMAW